MTASNQPKITGDLSILLEALGQPIDSPQARNALALVDAPMERKDYHFNPINLTYYTTGSGVAEFSFEDNNLVSATIQLVKSDKHDAYPTPDNIVKGLSGHATRAEVLAYFGEPEWSNNTADSFPVDNGLVRYEYVNDRTVQVIAMLPFPDL